MKYCFVLSYCPNPRMMKRASLARDRFAVSMLCWRRGDESFWGVSGVEGVDVHTVDIPASSGNPLNRIIPTLQFARMAIRILRDLQPDIIHVENLDMLIVARHYARTAAHRCRIVYEVADINSLLITHQKSHVKQLAQAILRSLDRRLSQHIDLFICTSPRYFDAYYSAFISRAKLIVMPNMPDLRAFSRYRRKTGSPFTVGFIGAVRYKEQMKMLIDSARESHVDVLFAGTGLDAELQSICQRESHVKTMGPYNYQVDIATLYGMVDCVYSVYDADNPNVKIALPNKLYEAIYCELPIIVARGTYLSELVEGWGVGIAVGHTDAKELTGVLCRLAKDVEYYDAFVEKCRAHKAEIDNAQNNKILSARLADLLL